MDTSRKPGDPRADLRAGAADIFPVVVAAFPIGLLFGALCTGKGLSAPFPRH